MRNVVRDLTNRAVQFHFTLQPEAPFLRFFLKLHEQQKIRPPFFAKKGGVICEKRGPRRSPTLLRYHGAMQQAYGIIIGLLILLCFFILMDSKSKVGAPRVACFCPTPRKKRRKRRKPPFFRFLRTFFALSSQGPLSATQLAVALLRPSPAVAYTRLLSLIQRPTYLHLGER